MTRKSISRSSLLLASAAAGLLTFSATVGLPGDAQAEDVKCYGVNGCKGKGECGGKGHSCAGKNECAGHGWKTLDKDECLAIKDGRLTRKAE